MKVLYVGNPVDSKIFGSNEKYRYTCYADNYMQIKFMNEIHKAYGSDFEISTINYCDNKKHKKGKFGKIESTYIKYNPKNYWTYYLSFMFNNFKEIIKFCKKYKKEEKVIITNGPYMYYSFPVIIAKLFFKFKYICYLICSVELPQYKGIYGLVAKMSKYLIKSADATITYVEKSSIDYTKKPYLCLDFHVDEEKIQLYDKFLNEKRDNENKKIIIAYTGALTQASGLNEMLNLINVLPNKFLLTVCGNGEGKESIEKLSKEKPKKLHYLGLLPPEEVITLQTKADILIVFRNKDTKINEYSSKYASSCKLFEYLLSSKPVVTNEHGALSKNLKPFLNIAKSTDTEYLKDYIINLSKKLNSKEVKEKCKKGREYIINNCGEGKQSNIIYEFINKIAKS